MTGLVYNGSHLAYISDGQGRVPLSQAEATVKKREASSPTMLENSGAQAISFIVRIWKQPGQVDSEYRGWIEHVQRR